MIVSRWMDAPPCLTPALKNAVYTQYNKKQPTTSVDACSGVVQAGHHAFRSLDWGWALLQTGQTGCAPVGSCRQQGLPTLCSNCAILFIWCVALSFHVAASFCAASATPAACSTRPRATSSAS
jgi:hypothetical protein